MCEVGECVGLRLCLGGVGVGWPLYVVLRIVGGPELVDRIRTSLRLRPPSAGHTHAASAGSSLGT